MNLGDLLKSCRELLGDEAQPYLWDDSELTRFLNNGVREACLRARLLKDDALSLPEICVLSLPANQPIVRYHRDILVVRSGHLLGATHKLWSLTSESMDRHRPNWESDSQQPGQPRYLIMDLAQKTLRIFPVPDQDYTLNIRVWRMPREKELMRNKGDCPVIHLPDPEELKHWVAHEAEMRKDSESEDAQRSGQHLALFEQRFGPRPSLHEMARWADSPPRVRHAHLF